MQLFAKLLAIPRIETFVDPAVIEHADRPIHDGAWLVDITLDDRVIGCILDGTVRVPAVDARRLEALAYRLPTVPSIAVTIPRPNSPPPDAWLTRWPDPQEIATGWPALVSENLESGCDPDTLTRLVAHEVLHEAHVILAVTTASSELVTPASIARLHARMPELRLAVLSTDPLPDALVAPLAAAGGAWLHLHGLPVASPRSEVVWTDVAIAIEPGRDAELVVHADGIEHRSAPRTHIHVPRPQQLHTCDSLRVDAIAQHVDEPVFTAHLRAARTDLPITCSVLHAAQRVIANPPMEAHVEAAIEARRIVVPTCELLDTAVARDSWVDGAIVFEIDGIVQRSRLHPAQRIATPTAAIEVRILRGDAYVRARAGTVFYDGVRIDRELYIAPYRPITLDDVRVTIAVRAAWSDDPPAVMIEGELQRYLGVLAIDGHAIELRRRPRCDELWLDGSPLALQGAVTTDDFIEPVVDSHDLSWLLRAAPLAGTSGVELVIAEHHGLSAKLIVDLAARTMTYVVRRRTQSGQ